MLENDLDDRQVLRAASERGYSLLQRELDTGQLAWAWVPQKGGATSQFLTRRLAMEYMTELLAGPSRHDGDQA